MKLSYRSVLEIGYGIAAHLYIVSFEYFKCTFKRYRISKTATESDGGGHAGIFLCEHGERLGHMGEKLGNGGSYLGKTGFQRGTAGNLGGEQSEQHHLRGKCLCGGDACFVSGIAEECIVNAFREMRALDIRNPRRERTAFLCVGNDGDNILSRARLLYADNERIAVVDRGAVF